MSDGYDIVNRFIFYFLCVAFFGAGPVRAQTLDDAAPLKIPRYDIGVTIEYKGYAKGVLAERMIQTQLNGDIWRVNWLAVSKNSGAAASPYPTYQVKTTKGILEGPMVGSKTRYFHPMLWPEGYAIVADAFPLWVDASYLDLKRGAAESFSIGFLKVEAVALQGLEATLAAEMQKFRDLYDDAENSKSPEGQAMLKTFDKTFFELRWLGDVKVSVKVNGAVRPLPAKTLGNRYFEMTVLDQYDNPLVLGLKFFPDRVPKAFYKSFQFLKKNFEFQVTQVQF